jgi:hypothetical protein
LLACNRWRTATGRSFVLRFLRSWCSAAAYILVGGALHMVHVDLESTTLLEVDMQ